MKYAKKLIRDDLQESLLLKKENYRKNLGAYFSKYPPTDRHLSVSFRFYRYLSFFLTSGFYLLETRTSSPFFLKLIIILLLFVFSFLVLQGYKHYYQRVRIVGALILMEIAAVVLLMAISGGSRSPFLWYALNPLIVASSFLPRYFTWVFLGIFFLWTAAADVLIQGSSVALLTKIGENADLVLITLLLTGIIQMFSRHNIIFKEQSHALQLQQGELMDAFQSLTENNLFFQTLSNFQRDVVSYKYEKDILSGLLKACLSIFPLSGATVLLFNKPLHPAFLTPGEIFKTINLKEEPEPLGVHILKEVRDCWQDFSTQKMLTGRKKDWLALPIWSFRERLAAVFVAKVREESKIMDFVNMLSLFISFSEQVIQGLSSLKLAEKNVQRIASLYEAVEMISMREDPQKAIDLFAAYARALTGCEKVIFWMEKPLDSQIDKGPGYFYAVRGKRGIFPEEQWREVLLQAWSEIRVTPRSLILEIQTDDFSRGGKGQLVCVPVVSRARCFGILAALQPQDQHDVEDITQILSFLAELSAVSIERSIADFFDDKLLVIEEQNRIANEIHDSISQNLFSIVYGLDVLHKKAVFLELEQQEVLGTIRKLAAQTARELRLLIYRLSPRHRGDNTFMNEVKTYLDGLANINSIAIDFQVTGREEFLNQTTCRAFYRMIKEATGNAVRHGKCLNITVELEMSPFGANLKIIDDGRGFDVSFYNKPVNSDGKLGLINMRELALSLQGTFNIESESGRGTVVHCSVPTSTLQDKALPN